MNATRNICIVDACDLYQHGQGYCSKHYQRFRKYGDPLKSAAYKTPQEAFAARTEWRAGCLVWTGGVTEDGYGRMRVGEDRILTHRYAWESARGPIPDGLLVDHMCHVTACCNVEHLRLVTDKQNSENKSGAHRNSGSGVLGVHRHGNRWRVKVRHYGVTYHGGSFSNIPEAAEAARSLRNRLFTHNDKDRKAA